MGDGKKLEFSSYSTIIWQPTVNTVMYYQSEIDKQKPSSETIITNLICLK